MTTWSHNLDQGHGRSGYQKYAAEGIHKVVLLSYNLPATCMPRDLHLWKLLKVKVFRLQDRQKNLKRCRSAVQN